MQDVPIYFTCLAVYSKQHIKPKHTIELIYNCKTHSLFMPHQNSPTAIKPVFVDTKNTTEKINDNVFIVVHLNRTETLKTARETMGKYQIEGLNSV